ncbi:MAG: Smr/MutS family protein [Pyrinomonadaceae bacterium]
MSWRELWRNLCAPHGARRAAAARPDKAETAVSANDEDDAAGVEVDLYNPFPEPIQLEITDVFDLHTIAPRDVGRVVEEYLREAHRLGFRRVRLIHGKGRGVQRATVRAILARTPFIVDWTDAPLDAGGFGATIARLRAPMD